MKNHEKAVREAASALKSAIGEAEKAGYRTTLPANWRDLDAIPVSETAKASVTVAVAGNVDSSTVDKAGSAAQKAVDKVVAKAK